MRWRVSWRRGREDTRVTCCNSTCRWDAHVARAGVLIQTFDCVYCNIKAIIFSMAKVHDFFKSLSWLFQDNLMQRSSSSHINLSEMFMFEYFLLSFILIFTFFIHLKLFLSSGEPEGISPRGDRRSAVCADSAACCSGAGHARLLSSGARAENSALPCHSAQSKSAERIFHVFFL